VNLCAGEGTRGLYVDHVHHISVPIPNGAASPTKLCLSISMGGRGHWTGDTNKCSNSGTTIHKSLLTYHLLVMQRN